MDVVDWLEEFRKTKAVFDSTRGCASAVVRIRFTDGSDVLAAGLLPGPGPDFLSISVYPKDPETDMVRTGDEVLPQTPTLRMAPLHTIASIELLTEAPADHRGNVGFRQRDSE